MVSGASEVADPARDFAIQLERTTDLLRALPIDRLTRVESDGLSIADRAFELSMSFVIKAKEIDDLAPTGPLPRLAPHAVGDQVAVTGQALVASAAHSNDNGTADVLAWASDECRKFRQRL